MEIYDSFNLYNGTNIAMANITVNGYGKGGGRSHFALLSLRYLCNQDSIVLCWVIPN